LPEVVCQSCNASFEIARGVSGSVHCPRCCARFAVQGEPEGREDASLASFLLTTFLVSQFLLATVLILLFLSQGPDDSKETRARAGAINVGKALRAYAQDRGGVYPDSLDRVTHTDRKGGAYLDPEGLLDPWGNRYKVDYAGPQHDGREPDVYTTSPEGRLIGNW